MLEVSHLTKAFGGLMAVNDVTFRVEEGEILGLIGPNGAGKTTLINMISGLSDVTSGQIRFDGEEITDRSAHRLTALGISRTYQNIRLFGEMTVLGNVLTGRHRQMRGAQGVFRWLLPWPDPAARAQREAGRHLLKQLGLAELADYYATELSYGDQRRVELARALATEPRLLLLDEPTAGMNQAETRQLGEFILGLRDQGVTVLVIEHDMELIGQICDRVIVLNFGSLIAEGTPNQIRANPAVIEAYLGDE